MEIHYITRSIYSDGGVGVGGGGMDPEEKQSILEHPENNDMVNGKIIL